MIRKHSRKQSHGEHYSKNPPPFFELAHDDAALLSLNAVDIGSAAEALRKSYKPLRQSNLSQLLIIQEMERRSRKMMR